MGRPGAVQLMIKDQEQDYFRVWMLRDGHPFSCARQGPRPTNRVTRRPQRGMCVRSNGKWPFRTRPGTSAAAYLGQARSPSFTAYVLGTAVDTRPIRLVVLG